MPGQYETANITYKGLEDKGLTFTLIDEKKGKWTLWKKDYQDKEKDSDAWASLQSLKMGDTFGVSYQEKDESFTDKKTGKLVNFKRKTIYSILPIITHPTSEMATSKPQAQQAPPKANSYIKDETTAPDWQEINIGKCQFGFLQAYIQSGKTFAETLLQVQQARRLAELVVKGSKEIDTISQAAKVADQRQDEPLPEPPPILDEENPPF